MAESDSPKAESGLTYRDSGVDIDAGNALVRAIGPLAARTKRAGMLGGLGGFGGLFDVKAAGFEDPILVAANDGVGTKLKIAIETGRHETIGIDLVAMCVNDLIAQGAEPLFFLDYFACGRLDNQVAEAVVSGIADGCKQAGAGLIGGETAEMPGLYGDGDYDLAGFTVGAAERGQLLPRSDIGAGDVLVGLRSSGAHSNGFSLIRRLVSDSGLEWSDPAPFTDKIQLGEALLVPTRIYVAPVLDAIRQTGAVKAVAHITGGGLTENLPRILPDDIHAEIDLSVIDVPPVFSWLAATGRIAEDEMLRTFNCGVGLVAVITRDKVDAVLEVFAGADETAAVIGTLTPNQGSSTVHYSGHLGLRQ